MQNLFSKSIILQEARKAKFQPNIVLQILIFTVVFFVGGITASILPSLLMIGDLFTSMSASSSSNLSIEDMTALLNESISPISIIVSLFCTVFTTAASIFYCRFLEKRSLSSMGFTKKKFVLRYLAGYLAGVLMIALIILMGVLTGAMEFKGFHQQIPFGLLIGFFLGYLVQGMSEEVLLRGYFMVSIQNRVPVFVAVLINSIVFAFMHLANQGITLLSVVNLCLFGVFASLFVLVTDQIWGICALHSAWNFAQGHLFGIEVSGINSAGSIWEVIPKTGKDIIHGGSFGLEGGILATIVLLLGIAGLLLYQKKKSSGTTE